MYSNSSPSIKQVSSNEQGICKLDSSILNQLCTKLIWCWLWLMARGLSSNAWHICNSRTSLNALLGLWCDVIHRVTRLREKDGKLTKILALNSLGLVQFTWCVIALTSWKACACPRLHWITPLKRMNGKFPLKILAGWSTCAPCLLAASVLQQPCTGRQQHSGNCPHHLPPIIVRSTSCWKHNADGLLCFPDKVCLCYAIAVMAGIVPLSVFVLHS